MTNKTTKNTFVAVAMTILAVFVMGSANADDSGDSKKVDMKFAGSLLLNVRQEQVGPNGQPLGSYGLISIAQTKAVGSLGRADIKVVSKAGLPESDKTCPEGSLKIADITDNSIVFTFKDLSLLFGDGQGVVCLSFADGSQFASVDGVWTGGTRRFANAAGEFSISIDMIVPVNPNTQFSAESGRITGYLTREH